MREHGKRTICSYQVNIIDQHVLGYGTFIAKASDYDFIGSTRFLVKGCGHEACHHQIPRLQIRMVSRSACAYYEPQL